MFSICVNLSATHSVRVVLFVWTFGLSLLLLLPLATIKNQNKNTTGLRQGKLFCRRAIGHQQTEKWFLWSF